MPAIICCWVWRIARPAFRWMEERTGVRAVIGGSHPGVGTCNALLSLGGRQYLEIIAPDPEQTQVAARYQILNTLNTPRLITWAAATDNAETTAKRCRAAGLDVLGPNPGSRQRPDGKLIQQRTSARSAEPGDARLAQPPVAAPARALGVPQAL
jgi:hypothetical protein